MHLRVLECPRCGAPLPRRAALVRLACEYCRSEVVVDRWAVKAADYRAALDQVGVEADDDVERVGGTAFRGIERLATGHSTDVFKAERAGRFRERVVIKRLRAPQDAGLLENEQAVLEALSRSTERGTEHFSCLLPQRAGSGQADGALLGSSLALVFREPAGFSRTLAAVARAFAGGLDPRHIVWLWRRALELLGWVHRSGFSHGALLPAHLLIHPRDHAVRLVGWSCAARHGARLVAMDERERALYPEDLVAGGRMTPKSDLTMLARALSWSAGGSATGAPETSPRALASLLEAQAHGEGEADAWALAEEVAQVARHCFGEPKFVALTLP